MSQYQGLARASFIKRVSASVYDLFILFALIMLVTGVYHTIFHRWIFQLEEAPVGYDPVLAMFLFLTHFFYFACYWRKQGQTLGMQAWRIRVQNHQGHV